MQKLGVHWGIPRVSAKQKQSPNTRQLSFLHPLVDLLTNSRGSRHIQFTLLLMVLENWSMPVVTEKERVMLIHQWRGKNLLTA